MFSVLAVYARWYARDAVIGARCVDELLSQCAGVSASSPVCKTNSENNSFFLLI